MEQLHDAALGFGTGLDERAGARHERPDVGPGPVRRRIRRRRLAPARPGDADAPERVHVLAFQIAVEDFEGVGRGVGHVVILEAR